MFKPALWPKPERDRVVANVALAVDRTRGRFGRDLGAARGRRAAARYGRLAVGAELQPLPAKPAWPNSSIR